MAFTMDKDQLKRQFHQVLPRGWDLTRNNGQLKRKPQHVLGQTGAVTMDKDQLKRHFQHVLAQLMAVVRAKEQERRLRIKRVFDEFKLKAHKFKPELPSLPDELKIRILQDILGLAESGYICPFYCKCFQPDLSVFNQTELSCIEKYGPPPLWSVDKREKRTNLDLSLLGLNEDYNKVLSKFIYAHNVFVFNDARSCLWFLKRIGRTNLSQLTTVVFNLGSGYFLSSTNRSKFDMCEERLWCEVFLFLRHRHQIQRCTIRFVGFNDLTDRKDLNDDDKVDITRSRIELVDVLTKIHDVKEVLLENEHCQFLSYEVRDQLGMSMVHVVGPMDGMSIVREVD